MRSALLLTGHMRCWKDVFPHLKKTILDVYNPDVFIHTWDTEGYWTGKMDGKGFNTTTSPLLNTGEVISYYQPKDICVEKFEDVEPELIPLANTIQESIIEELLKLNPRPLNVISQVRKWYKSFEVLESYCKRNATEYDLVIRTRPDLILKEPIEEISNNYFYTIPGSHTRWPGMGTGDCIQIGNFNNMKYFVSIYHNIERLLTDHRYPCLHTVSKTWIKEIKLPWKELNNDGYILHSPNGMYREA